VQGAEAGGGYHGGVKLGGAAEKFHRKAAGNLMAASPRPNSRGKSPDCNISGSSRNDERRGFHNENSPSEGV